MSLPLLPIIIKQGKKIRAEVPELPEASNPKGYVNLNASKTIQVIFIGESTFAGVGVATHKEGFTGTLAQHIANQYHVNVKWSVYARSGYTARKMHEKLLPKIQETEADLIVIGAGGNDAFKLNHPLAWKRDMSNLIYELKDRYMGTPIACTNMPPIKIFPAFTKTIKFVIGNLGEILGDELHSLTKSINQVYYNEERIDGETWKDHLGTAPEIDTLFSDGVHPSKLTYQLWAEDFMEFIKRKQIITLS